MGQRYVVTAVLWEEKKRLARKYGWDGVDTDMVSDYTEPEDGEVQYGPFTSLSRAFTRAKQALVADSYGQTNVYLQEKDDSGVWDDVCVWYVCHDTKSLKQTNPDHRYEVAA